MKTKEELKKHLDWINQNLDGLEAKKLEVEKQLEELEKPEFDFEKLMPVGSVWLGKFDILRSDETTHKYPLCLDHIGWPAKPTIKTIYHAHKIVKAAQEWENYRQTDGDDVQYVMLLGNLERSVRAAKADGVLQNLE